MSSKRADGLRFHRSWILNKELDLIWGCQGKAEGALRLFEQREISRSRCRELIGEILMEKEEAINAPWERLNWCEEDTE